ncbi:MAG: hypothetical protein GY845_03240 [Planctomycetes bacterium]|nr:hypothetical protein [Planctomycetota bacterium]
MNPKAQAQANQHEWLIYRFRGMMSLFQGENVEMLKTILPPNSHQDLDLINHAVGSIIGKLDRLDTKGGSNESKG